MEAAEARKLVQGADYRIITNSGDKEYVWLIRFHHFDEENNRLYNIATLCITRASFFSSYGRGGFADADIIQGIYPITPEEQAWLEAAITNGKWLPEPKTQINNDYELF